MTQAATSVTEINSTQTVEIRVKRVLEKVRPYIQTHGGDVWLVSIENETVTLKIEGSCVGCRLANFTYNRVVKTLLIEEVPEIRHVVLT
jgi:Fe-S cluster biogenesis protein NfuA